MCVAKWHQQKSKNVELDLFKWFDVRPNVGTNVYDDNNNINIEKIDIPDRCNTKEQQREQWQHR